MRPCLPSRQRTSPFFLFAFLLHVHAGGFAQYSQEALAKYLSADLSFTRKGNAAYLAVAVRQNDHWQLIARYPDSSLLLTMYFQDRALTVKDGPFTLYHDKNIIAAEGYYKNDKREGVWKIRHPSGYLKDSGLYVEGEQSGTWHSWYENGRLHTVATFRPPDSIAVNPLAQLDMVPGPGIFSDKSPSGMLQGSFSEYAEQGDLQSKGTYRSGKKNGYWEFFYPSGMPDCRGTFEDDLQTDDWEYFYENGQPSTKEIYRTGKLTELTCYDSAGRREGDLCSIQKPAIALIDRYTNFITYMYDHLQWPDALKGKAVNGMVVLTYTIAKNGELQRVEIESSPHELISKEVLRFFCSIKAWSPAMSHNRPVAYSQRLELPFFR